MKTKTKGMWVCIISLFLLPIAFAVGMYSSRPHPIAEEARASVPVPSNPPPNQMDTIHEKDDNRIAYVRSVRIMEGDEQVWDSLSGVKDKIGGCNCPRYVLEFCPVAVEKDYGLGKFYRTKTVIVAIASVGGDDKKVITMEVDMGKLCRIPIVLERKKLWHIELHDSRGFYMLDIDRYNRDINAGQFIHSVGWLSWYTVEAI